MISEQKACAESDGEESRSTATVLSHLAEVLRARRQEIGLSLEECSTRADVSIADMQALEQGEWDIDLLSLSRIAHSLDVPLTGIFWSLELCGKSAR